jgi:hypothetical protein
MEMFNADDKIFIIEKNQDFVENLLSKIIEEEAQKT